MMGNPNSEGDAHAHNPGCLPRAAMMLLRHFDCDAVVVVVFRGAKPELASVSKAGAEWAALVWLEKAHAITSAEINATMSPVTLAIVPAAGTQDLSATGLANIEAAAKKHQAEPGNPRSEGAKSEGGDQA